MNRDNHNINQAYLKSRLLKEGMEHTYPTNWNKGFQHPIRIAGDGTEEPFLKDGKWHVRVFDSEKKKHFLYSYADDTFYPEDHGISDHLEGDYENRTHTEEDGESENVALKLAVYDKILPINYLVYFGKDNEDSTETENEDMLFKWMTRDLQLNPDQAKQLMMNAQNNLGKEFVITKMSHGEAYNNFNDFKNRADEEYMKTRQTEDDESEKKKKGGVKGDKDENKGESATDREHDEKHDMSSLNLPSPGSREDRESLGDY